MPRLLRTLSFVTLLVAGGDARAQLITIPINEAEFRPYPVAVPEPVLNRGKADKAKKTLRDLQVVLHSGVELARALRLVPPKSYLNPKKEPWASPMYANWVNVGASGLIRSAIEIKGNEVKVGFRFFDVVSQRELLHRSYDKKLATAANAGNAFLDELLELLTGERGIFSSRLAFVKRTSGGKAVFVSDVHGRNMRRLTDEGVLSLLPEWGPRGRTVLFTSYLKGNPDLFRMTLAGRKLEWLSNKRGLNTGANVSPDGSHIALTLSIDGNTEIYVMDWHGKNLKRLTKSWGQDVSPTWSPDGSQLAFVSSRSGQPHLYTMNADGTGPKRITFQGTYNQEPDWSPRKDGQIVFTARDEFLKYDIFLVDPKSKQITRLTQDEGNNESPSFSPDGHHVLFTSSRPPNRGKKLYIMDVDGQNQRRVSRDQGYYETPAWGPRLGD